MKLKDVEIGGVYLAKVSGRVVPVRVTGDFTRWDHRGVGRVGFDVVNLVTKRKLRFKSAAKLRAHASDAYVKYFGKKGVRDGN